MPSDRHQRRLNAAAAARQREADIHMEEVEREELRRDREDREVPMDIAGGAPVPSDHDTDEDNEDNEARRRLSPSPGRHEPDEDGPNSEDEEVLGGIPRPEPQVPPGLRLPTPDEDEEDEDPPLDPEGGVRQADLDAAAAVQLRVREELARQVHAQEQRHMDEDMMDILRNFAYQVGGRTTRVSNDLFRHLFGPRINTPSDYVIQSTVTELSNCDIERYHCCIDSCMAFTGPDKDLRNCRYCQASRFKPDGKTPQKLYAYIPLIPRLIGFYRSEEMAKRLGYRAKYDEARDPTMVGDVFDGKLYEELRRRKVVVDGEELPHKFFSDPHDIALALPGDGFQVFKRKIHGTASASALILVNLNLDSKIRTHQDNVLSLGLIPGEHGPKDTNSFLFPFREEAAKLARGVENVYDAARRILFTLRAYVIHIIGDAVWIEKIQCMNGHNGFCPCRVCPIRGVYHERSKHYYFPLTTPGAPEERETYSLTDLLRTHKRKHEDFITVPQQMQNLDTAEARRLLGRRTGFAGESIFIHFPSINMVRSFPHDFMHLLFRNVVPNLIYLWKGKYKRLREDEGTGNFIIPDDVWDEIGEETLAATRTLPSNFVSVLPNIATDQSQYTAEMYAFWFLYLGPILLRNRFPEQRYYTHYLKLVKWIKKCMRYTIPRDELHEMQLSIIEWVKTYEEYYYQYDYDRLTTCLWTIHALLHVVDDIRNCGPVWVAWAFVMERFCYALQISVKSRLHPWGSLANRMRRLEQLRQLKARYGLWEDLSFYKRLGDTTRGEHIYHTEAYKDFIVRPPKNLTHRLTGEQRFRIATFLVKMFDGRYSNHQLLRLVPREAERWSGLRMKGGGDIIRCRVDPEQRTSTSTRDSSFVCFTLWVDQNEGDQDAPYAFVERTFYGQLLDIFGIHIDPNPDFGLNVPLFYLLAHAQPCPGDGNQDAADETVVYCQAEFNAQTPVMVDVPQIIGSVGCVFGDGEWGIVDRHNETAPAQFEFDENEQPRVL